MINILDKEKTLVPYGYAHGDYTCACSSCESLFDGEKRSYKCHVCAFVEYKLDGPSRVQANKKAAMLGCGSRQVTVSLVDISPELMEEFDYWLQPSTPERGSPHDAACDCFLCRISNRMKVGHDSSE